MKAFKIVLLTLCLFSINSVFAEQIISSKKAVKVARIVKVITLVEKPGIQVSVAIEDLGGSTDVSNTQAAHFNLYSKGEMFSTDASFELGSFYSIKGARRVSGGIYELVGTDAETMRDVTVTIDARAAIVAIKNVKCEDFDCAESENFSSSINVVRK